MDLDPFNAFVHTNLLIRYEVAGESDRAVALGVRLERDYPEVYGTNWVFYWSRGMAYCRRGAFVEAARDQRKAIDLAGGALEPVPDLAFVLGRAGRRADALALLDRLEKESKRRYVPSFFFAMVHAGLGDKDRAFEYLDRAVEERDWRVQYLGGWGVLSTVLRGDPRWDTLLHRIGIPDVVAPRKSWTG